MRPTPEETKLRTQRLKRTAVVMWVLGALILILSIGFAGLVPKLTGGAHEFAIVLGLGLIVGGIFVRRRSNPAYDSSRFDDDGGER